MHLTNSKLLRLRSSSESQRFVCFTDRAQTFRRDLYQCGIRISKGVFEFAQCEAEALTLFMISVSQLDKGLYHTAIEVTFFSSQIVCIVLPRVYFDRSTQLLQFRLKNMLFELDLGEHITQLES